MDAMVATGCCLFLVIKHEGADRDPAACPSFSSGAGEAAEVKRFHPHAPGAPAFLCQNALAPDCPRGYVEGQHAGNAEGKPAPLHIARQDTLGFDISLAKCLGVFPLFLPTTFKQERIVNSPPFQCLRGVGSVFQKAARTMKN